MISFQSKAFNVVSEGRKVVYDFVMNHAAKLFFMVITMTILHFFYIPKIVFLSKIVKGKLTQTNDEFHELQCLLFDSESEIERTSKSFKLCPQIGSTLCLDMKVGLDRLRLWNFLVVHGQCALVPSKIEKKNIISRLIVYTIHAC